MRGRVAKLVGVVRGLPVIRTVLAANDGYNAAGGGLLAAGLAFSALFAVIPGLLLVVSLLVVVVDDAASRQRVIGWIVDQVPPLREVATTVVTNLASDAKVGSVLGLALFAWGASSFYLGLQNAIDRTLPGGHPENPLLARVQAVLAVALLVFAALAGFVVAGLASVMSLGAWAPVLSPLAAIVDRSRSVPRHLPVPAERPSDGPRGRDACARRGHRYRSPDLILRRAGAVARPGLRRARRHRLRVRGARVVRLDVPDPAARRELRPPAAG